MTAEVKGLPELKAKFAQVESAVSKRVIRKGSGVGAKIVKAAIHPPVKSGTLKRSLLIKWAREKSDATQSVHIVTFRQGKRLQVGAITKRKGRFFKRVLSQDAFYARWVEGGHRLRRRRGGGGGGSVPGQYFMRDGVRNSQAQALQKMVDVMSEEIVKIVK